MTTSHDHIEVGGTSIAYEFLRSPHRRTISINVHPDGAVSVQAPKGTRRTRIGEAVWAKRVWILNQQEHFRRLARTREKRFVSGESFLYLGRQYKLLLLPDDSDSGKCVRMHRGSIEVRHPSDLSDTTRASYVRTALVGWYRAKALRRFEDLTTRYARNIGVAVDAVRVREMKRRWGSASTRGTITYNWKAILAPTRLGEYVVAHEVCHLKHDDHSGEFWRLLERTMPDYERRRLDLAVHGPRFDIS